MTFLRERDLVDGIDSIAKSNSQIAAELAAIRVEMAEFVEMQKFMAINDGRLPRNWDEQVPSPVPAKDDFP